MMKLPLYVLIFATALVGGQAYDWRDYEDWFGPPIYAVYLRYNAIPKDLCITASDDGTNDVTLEECDLYQKPPHNQIWYSSRSELDLVKSSLDGTDWQTSNVCLSYLVDGPAPSGPIELMNCDDVLPSHYWFMVGHNIFWDWDDQLCMIPETNSCPTAGDRPIMSLDCDYNVYNYGHTWDIVYVKPARAQNAIPLISSGTILQDSDIPVEVSDGDDTLTMDQQRDGNFIVRRNGSVVFATASYPDAGSLDYYTKLQGDCNLITFQGTPSDKGDVAWKSDYRIDHMPGSYHGEIDCFLAFNRDDDTLSVYVGTPDEVFGELWNSDY